jgi:hypothetical protein
MVADVDNIAMFEPVRNNQVFIDESAIFALQVYEDKPVPHRVDLGMMSRYRRILDDNVVLISPADGQGKVVLKLIVTQQFILKSKR